MKALAVKISCQTREKSYSVYFIGTERIWTVFDSQQCFRVSLILETKGAFGPRYIAIKPSLRIAR